MRKRFAVIGYPLAHSLSPHLHNASFKSMKLDCTYSAIEIAPEALEKKIAELRENYAGLNVTIPHKIAIIKHLDAMDVEAERIGAVNAVKIEDGRMHGYNTDGPALREALGSPKSKKILILGAGGAARAAAFSLAKDNKVTIWNRTGEKARELAEAAGAYASEDLEASVRSCDILVNTTSVGMHPNTEETPVSEKALSKAKKGMVVCDIIYNPLRTKLLDLAEKTGHRTISGVEMFVRQAALSEKIWLGIEPDIKFMRETVVKELEQK